MVSTKLLFAAVLAAPGPQDAGALRPFRAIPPRVTVLEHDAGWRSLFDGAELGAWAVGEGGAWEADPRHHVLVGTAGALAHPGPFADFELELVWRSVDGGTGALVTRGGELELPARSHTGRARVVARGDRVRAFVDGAEATLSPTAGPAPESGPIELRADGRIEVRSVKVRDLRALPGAEVELFGGGTLDAWQELGDAEWTLEGEELVGEVGGGSQSFLATREAFGDFLLEVELRNEAPGNSGIQVRSDVTDSGRMQGWQIEVDPSERAWSGGLYDEARRGWLQDLADDERARAAFRPGEWNRYRIECLGPWVRSWVNDVPVTDYMDSISLKGHIGLQVHSGDDTRMRWRDLRLRDLGRRSWRDLRPRRHHGEWRKRPMPGRSSPVLSSARFHDDLSLQIRIDDLKDGVRLHFRSKAMTPDLVRDLVERGPGLYAYDKGWLLDLAEEPFASTETPFTVELHAYGPRVAVSLDGELLADVREPALDWSGLIVIEPPADGGALATFDRFFILSPLGL